MPFPGCLLIPATRCSFGDHVNVTERMLFDRLVILSRLVIGNKRSQLTSLFQLFNCSFNLKHSPVSWLWSLWYQQYLFWFLLSGRILNFPGFFSRLWTFVATITSWISLERGVNKISGRSQPSFLWLLQGLLFASFFYTSCLSKMHKHMLLSVLIRN